MNKLMVFFTIVLLAIGCNDSNNQANNNSGSQTGGQNNSPGGQAPVADRQDNASNEQNNSSQEVAEDSRRYHYQIYVESEDLKVLKEILYVIMVGEQKKKYRVLKQEAEPGNFTLDIRTDMKQEKLETAMVKSIQKAGIDVDARWEEKRLILVYEQEE